MKINTRIAVLLGVLTLLVTPTAALAIGPEYEVEHVAPAPGAGASLKAKKKAYGVYCSGFPKKKAKGQKFSPYERCLTSMAKTVAAKKTPKIACTGFSKKHVKGKTGTEFSRCVIAAGEAKREGALQPQPPPPHRRPTEELANPAERGRPLLSIGSLRSTTPPMP